MKVKRSPLATLFAALAQNVEAAHPLLADDTGTQDQGNQQLEAVPTGITNTARAARALRDRSLQSKSCWRN